MIEELKRAGVDIQFCERPITDSPDDQLLLQIQGAIAEYERAKLLERCRRGRLHLARTGELGLVHPPYGYRYAAKKYGGDGRVHVHEAEAAMVRQIFDWYAQEGVALNRVVQRLNQSTWRTRSGTREWSASTVLHMLHCEWYVGTAFYNRTQKRPNEPSAFERSGKRAPKYPRTVRPRAEWIPIPVPPIIDEALFARVQTRIQENRRFSRRRLKHEAVFLLKGLMKCGLCGYAYLGETSTNGRRAGGGYVYHYYVCSRYTGPPPGAPRCTNARLRVAGVNEVVWTAVCDLLLDSEALARELTLWVDRTTRASPDSEARLQKAESRLEELTRQCDRLTDAYQAGVLSLDAFQSRMKAIEDSRLAAELTMAELRGDHLQAEILRARADGAEAVIERLRPQLLKADFNTQQTILRLLIERVVVTGHRIEIQLAIPVSGNFGLTSERQGLHPPYP